MPHSIFFTKASHTIHGSFDVKNIGRPASLCVRLQPENAAKLFALVKAEGVLNTTVVLTGPGRTPRRWSRRRVTSAKLQHKSRRAGLQQRAAFRTRSLATTNATVMCAARRPLYHAASGLSGCAQEVYRPRRYLFDP